MSIEKYGDPDGDTVLHFWTKCRDCRWVSDPVLDQADIVEDVCPECGSVYVIDDEGAL